VLKINTNIEHLIPNGVKLEPVELSIVVPALNEEITVGEFVQWCHQGISKAGVSSQILIVDSSTDNTPSIVLKNGAEVLRVPKRGLGRAYIDSIPYIRGKWIIMGDADLTYDFREVSEFIKEFKKGFEYVMGSRFAGAIEDGAMPALHRYFGTPCTTWILNRIYGSNYSDIHCGMRGITKEGLTRLALKSQSWEYASEMVLKASRLNLKISEVPVRFYKDREGRTSHHRRMGWISPWIAGWLNLKVMLVYTPDSFLLKPGFFMLVVGLILVIGRELGPISIGPIEFNFYWMLLGLTFATLGYGFIQVGVAAQMMHGLRPVLSKKLQNILSYNKGFAIAVLCIVSGLLCVYTLVKEYLNNSYRLSSISSTAILGLFLIIIGFQTFCFTLMLEMGKRVYRTD
jgi:glycosyltransferase involved in cell wall biosynthesis